MLCRNVQLFTFLHAVGNCLLWRPVICTFWLTFLSGCRKIVYFFLNYTIMPLYRGFDCWNPIYLFFYNPIYFQSYVFEWVYGLIPFCLGGTLHLFTLLLLAFLCRSVGVCFCFSSFLNSPCALIVFRNVPLSNMLSLFKPSSSRSL